MPLSRSSPVACLSRAARAGLLATLLALGAGMPPAAGAAAIAPIDVVPIPGGEFTYQAAGEFLDQGRPVDAPRVQGRVADGLVIMRRQVSQAEYARCVQAGACKRLDKGFRDLDSPDLPAVGVSWADATAYAAWLSRETGQHWRLPVYAEWVRAAADRYREEGALPSDPADPAVRWLAEYEREIVRSRGRIKPAQPFGHFGVNALGVSDMGGNVWEWTDTCFASHSVGALPLAPRENCGVRILAGAHIAAMADFIRDPRNGACSIGLPPSNLGFRLVREE
ncbi:formylglycine-generating enzyme family protein [Castellaniella denitrificans]|jgi:formylglycine-generating enzyme required for sulfatase activity|uniref:formylglycine-generating enzyme family protein n=1 Tax=Castellaniella denitrificans TaxID=56119 RepID=UPI003607F24E